VVYTYQGTKIDLPPEEEDFFELLRLAFILDEIHIVEWECFRQHSHMDLLKLSKDERKAIYDSCRDPLVRSLMARNATNLIMEFLK